MGACIRMIVRPHLDPPPQAGEEAHSVAEVARHSD